MTTAREFLTELFSGTQGVIELVFIAPPEYNKMPHITWLHYAIGGTRRVDWDTIQARNASGFGCYYGVTTKRRVPDKRACENDTLMLPALFAEIDMKDGHYPDKEAAISALNNLPHMPTTIIDSGGGIHALWQITPVLVTRNNRDRIKRILKGMALRVKGDTSVAETARVLRLPETINTKKARNGARCTVIDVLPARYTLDQFDTYAVKERQRQRTPLVLPFGAQTNLPPFTRNYLEYGAPEGKRSMHLFAAAIDYRANGYTLSDAERDLGGRARLDGLTDLEIERILRSGWASKHGSPNVDQSIRTRLRGLGGEA